MQAQNQEVEQLKLRFAQLDSDHDGYINKEQLQIFMKEDKLFNILPWKVTDAMNLMGKKMSEEDFILWIMGCRIGLEDFAGFKFNISKSLKKLKSAAGPSAAISNIKKSSIDINVNKQQAADPSKQHFLKIQIGIDKQKSQQERNQLAKVLGKPPSQIYFLLKIRTVSNGEQIAAKLKQIVEFGTALGLQLGPDMVTIVQSLKITSKWINQYIYLVIELENVFFNTILKYLDEAVQQLSPECTCILQAKIASDFSKVLQPQFNPLNQPIDLWADFEVDGNSLAKLKEKMIEKFQQSTDDQKVNLMFLFLLEQVNLALSFCNLKECFESFGLKENDIPKPGMFAGQIKNIQIKQLINQFIPEGDKLLSTISESCKAQGQISVHIKSLNVGINFNLNIQGAFDLL